jgi:hypothetical protein
MTCCYCHERDAVGIVHDNDGDDLPFCRECYNEIAALGTPLLPLMEQSK